MTDLKEVVHEMFENASSLILQESIDEPEFQLCVSTIMISIEYLEAKRSQEWACMGCG